MSKTQHKVIRQNVYKSLKPSSGQIDVHFLKIFHTNSCFIVAENVMNHRNENVKTTERLIRYKVITTTTFHAIPFRTCMVVFSIREPPTHLLFSSLPLAGAT